MANTSAQVIEMKHLSIKGSRPHQQQDKLGTTGAHQTAGQGPRYGAIMAAEGCRRWRWWCRGTVGTHVQATSARLVRSLHVQHWSAVPRVQSRQPAFEMCAQAGGASYATQLPVPIEYHHKHSGQYRVSILSRLRQSETPAWGHSKTRLREIQARRPVCIHTFARPQPWTTWPSLKDSTGKISRA